MRGWKPHRHQIDMLRAARRGEHALLMAPTGGGKTLSGFLPSLIDISERKGEAGLHTVYVSPLKALAVDIHRNVELPISELSLPVRTETRTGDTPSHKRRRQRRKPPHILMTTPESLALLLSYADAPRLFRTIRCLIVDELHALAGTKRGDLLALNAARLQTWADGCRRVGLSATAAHPEALRDWLSPQGNARIAPVRTISAKGGRKPRIRILLPRGRMPWSGHMAVHAMPNVYDRIRKANMSIVFVNTRAQAELAFRELWRLNDENLAIGIHHGSLSREQRRRIEAAMARGELRAVVATSSLDLGLDWGNVDLVIQVGAPKGSSRLLQRIGRANHRLDEPSEALLVPANRFELLECRAAMDAVRAGELDGTPPVPGSLDVLAQHVICVACAEPFDADALFDEVRAAAPYGNLPRGDFDDVLRFVADGGYALGSYDRFKRLAKDEQDRYRIADRTHARRYRMNAGTIVEAPKLFVRLGRGRVLGEIEESFVNGLTPGDTFVFAGETLRFERLRETTVETSRAPLQDPKVPAYAGCRLPLTTNLADRVRSMLSDANCHRRFPSQIREWLKAQTDRSALPGGAGLLVETFPRGGKQFLVAYCFEGRNAHQTLGMLLTRRMERLGLRPLGFVATDYVIAVWSLREVTDPAALFGLDMMAGDLEEWMQETSMMKRTFRNVAVIAGLIERRHPGGEKSRRQVTFSSDLIYDVLRRYEPDHILLRATRADAAGHLVDLDRLFDMIRRIQGAIAHRRLDRVSPLAVPVLLEIGRENVYGLAGDDLLDEAAGNLIEEAMARNGPVPQPIASAR